MKNRSAGFLWALAAVFASTAVGVRIASAGTGQIEGIVLGLLEDIGLIDASGNPLISGFDDVDDSGRSNGDLLVFNAAAGTWRDSGTLSFATDTPTFAGDLTVPGTLDLAGVQIDPGVPSDNDILVYDLATDTYQSEAPAATGLDQSSWDASAGVAPIGTSTFATLDTRGASGTVFHVLDFDDTGASGDESIIFRGTASDAYTGTGNITLTILWSATSATSGDTTWLIAFMEVLPGTTDIDAASFDTAQSATTTTSGTSGVLNTTTYTLANADIDALTAGSPFQLLVVRDSNNFDTDTMVGDAEIQTAYIDWSP